jgi:hypothetical protein
MPAIRLHVPLSCLLPGAADGFCRVDRLPPEPPVPCTAGLFSKSYPGYPWVYSCSRYHDKLMLAAGWLYRATGAHRCWYCCRHPDSGRRLCACAAQGPPSMGPLCFAVLLEL